MVKKEEKNHYTLNSVVYVTVFRPVTHYTLYPMVYRTVFRPVTHYTLNPMVYRTVFRPVTHYSLYPMMYIVFGNVIWQKYENGSSVIADMWNDTARDGTSSHA